MHIVLHFVSIIGLNFRQVSLTGTDVQIDPEADAAAGSRECHLEFASYGDLSSLTWVANRVIPASLSSKVVDVKVAYGESNAKCAQLFKCIDRDEETKLHI